MAPKRASPLDEPPAASSSEEEETSSGSGSEDSGSEEEEEEVPQQQQQMKKAPAATKAPATTKAPSASKPSTSKAPPAAKNTGAAAPAKAQSSSAAAAKPKSSSVAAAKPPPTPAAAAKPQSSSSSGETDSDSDSESEDETVGKSNPVVKPIASKPMDAKPKEKPSGTAAPERSGSKRPRGDDIEATKESKRAKAEGKKKVDNEVEESKRAKAEGKKKVDNEVEDGVEEEAKKPLFQRVWSDADELVILQGMIEFSAKRKLNPYSNIAAFHEFIKKSLQVKDVTKIQLQDKIRRLKKKFENNSKKKQLPKKDHDLKVFKLSEKVWGNEDDGKAGAAGPSDPDGKARARSARKSETKSSVKVELLASRGSLKPSKVAQKAGPSKGAEKHGPSKGAEKHRPSKAAEKAGPSKAAEKLGPSKPSVAAKKQCASGSILMRELVGYDKGFLELGMSEIIVQQGLKKIGKLKCAELENKWRKLHVAELKLYIQESGLRADVAKTAVEVLESRH